MKKILTLILLIYTCTTIPVYASTDINLKCQDEAMVGNEIFCSIDLVTEEPIKGIFLKYEFDPILTYNKTELGTNWKKITNSSKGFTIVNVDGIKEENNLAKVHLLISNDAKPGKEYLFNLKDIQLSNGDKDIDIEEKISKIKILSVQDIIKKLKVYNMDLEIKDGITNYTVSVPNSVTEVDILATLKEDKYQFVDGYGPRKIENLNIGDNFFQLQIKKDDLILLTYEICINRSVIEEETPNEEITNPKTGSLATKIVAFVTIISFCTLIISIKKRDKVLKK